jgi:hypothetical protein
MSQGWRYKVVTIWNTEWNTEWFSVQEDCVIHARGMSRDVRKAWRYSSRSRVYFYAFRKSSNITSAWITLSCLENHLVIVLCETVKQWHFENPAKIPRRYFNSSCRIAWSCTAIDQSNCVFHCSYYIKTVPIQHTVTTSCHKSVHKLSTSCVRTACS